MMKKLNIQNKQTIQEDGEFNFQRQKIPKVKRLKKHILQKQESDKLQFKQAAEIVVEQVKRCKGKSTANLEDITYKKGKNNFNSEIESIEFDQEEKSKKESKKLFDASTHQVQLIKDRHTIFLSISKSTSAFLHLLQNSQSKTKTQQFIERTVLLQKVVPKQMCQLCSPDDFVKIKVLGQGACGLVEKQLFKPLEQEVAMKKYLKEDNLEEFDSEVFIMKKKQSEYIPKLIFYQRETQQIYMELGMITLETYDLYLRHNSIQFDEKFAVWILKQLLIINMRMYEDGFHHSDIKPGNIIITFNELQEMKIKLIDFGAASIFTDDYWIQYTPQFQCQDLFKKVEQSMSLNRSEIFFAEFFASCRSIQLLTLANHPKRKQLFLLNSLSEYLCDKIISEKYSYLKVIFSYMFKLKNIKSLDKDDFLFLYLLLNVNVNTDNYVKDVENAYQQAESSSS